MDGVYFLNFWQIGIIKGTLNYNFERERLSVIGGAK